MINIGILNKVTNKYSKKELPFLHEMKERLQDTRPYQKILIFHNTPITLAALIKIECLVLGGAEVIVSGLSTLPPHQFALKILQKSGIILDLEKKLTITPDIHLDCCGELVDKIPHIGTAELTQTGDHIYRNRALNYPVISVDASQLKWLETIGTGIAFTEAFQRLTQSTLKNKKVVIFGFGKVGQGIVQSLEQQTNDLVIIEKNQNIATQMNCLGYNTLSFSELHKIRKEISNAFCIVTATGISDLLSTAFTRQDFGDAYLANMGATDEYGPKFKSDEVLFEKKPINFYLEQPTPLHFLDPIFYAHNMSTDLILSKKFQKGYHPFPSTLANEILQKWAKLNPGIIKNTTSFNLFSEVAALEAEHAT